MADTSNDNVLKGSVFGMERKEIEIPVSSILSIEPTSAENIWKVSYRKAVDRKTIELNINSPVSCRMGNQMFYNIEDIVKVLNNISSQASK